MKLRSKKTKQIHFNTDVETYEKAIIYKKKLNNPTFEEIFRIGLNTICNEKNLTISRLKKINHQTKMMERAIESNKEEGYKLRKALYQRDPHLLSKEDLEKLYIDFVEDFCYDYVAFCEDKGLSIVKSEKGKKVIDDFVKENNLNFEKFYSLTLDYLEKQ